ncbi:MAG TPA: S46 family peptidase [Longimicrobium sp.]|nr:S46 family peptidase [Longimicrobium sp.]
MIAKRTLLCTALLAALAAPAVAQTPLPTAGNTAQWDTFRARPFDTGRMWTFDFPPLDYLQRTYNFRPTQAWLDNVRSAALRFATWCSASFVSPTGLVLSNHHCAVPTLEGVQRQGEDLLTNGFLAATLADERRAPGLFVEQLVTIEDVTRQMTAPLEGAGTDAEKATAQTAVRRQLEQPDSARKMRYQVVEFYNGGRYSRYGYRRYDDVRLVFVPEQQIAFFGGDPDNFNYPRYALDMSLYRVYDDNGQPLRPANYLRWSTTGARENDLVFMVGNPGSTQRQLTNAQLEFLRDVTQSAQLAVNRARREAILAIGRRDEARRLQLRDELFSIENSIKAVQGRYEGEADPAFFGRKVAWERDFRAAVGRNPQLQQRYGARWDSITAIQAAKRQLAPGIVWNGYLNYGPLGNAIALVRAAEPNGTSFRSAAMARTDRSAAEQEVEMAALLNVARQRTPNDSLLATVLNGRTPEVAAREIVAGWTLADTTARRTLLQGGAAAVAASNDPVIALARRIAPTLAARNAAWQALQARENVHRAQLGRAFYEVYGTNVPPDATFTLRLADGVVKGYEAGGMMHPWHTTFYGLYNRALGFEEKGDFDLPRRWERPPPGLDLATPFNFVSTNDIIGGNSGSPVLNRNMEVVGLVFDGNLESLPGNFIFDESQNRSISVHSAGILAVLRHYYNATRIVNELSASR